MKRSEVIQELERSLKFIGLDCDPMVTNLGYDNRVLIVSQLLKQLEELGMLPPPTKTDVVTDCLVYCYYPKTEGKINDILDIENSTLWETEDD